MAITEKLSIWTLDVDKFVKVNECKEITDPVAFNNNNSPSPNGLLSYQIFGITKEERANIYAYIDLSETFINPLHYRIWSKVESKVKQCVHGTNTFKINSKGELEEDPNGESGIEFLKKNVDKLSFGHGKRVNNIEFLKKNKDTMFTTKLIVIPPYYRDVNTDQAKLGLGEINKLYQSVIIAVRSLKDSKDYGLTLSDATRGRIQELLVQIYDWFGAGTTINGVETGGNLPGKFGVIARANMSKTTDYSTRLVITAPNLKVENLDDLMVDPYHCALPLASTLANFNLHILFWLRRFFENEFAGKNTFPVFTDGEIVEMPLRDWQIKFSDTNLQKQIDRFIHGYSNRFIPVEAPIDPPKTKKNKVYLHFKGRYIRSNGDKEFIDAHKEEYQIINRPLTWCDLFFMAAVEVTKNKTVLATRFPMDSYFNQFPTEVVISSTKDTEPMYIDNHGFYKWYPKIRVEDIGKNTSNKFVDSLVFNNTRLAPIGGDYDGDQMTIKPIYGQAANKELHDFIRSKAALIDLGGSFVAIASKEAIQSLYNLTMCPDKEYKFTDPVF